MFQTVYYLYVFTETVKPAQILCMMVYVPVMMDGLCQQQSDKEFGINYEWKFAFWRSSLHCRLLWDQSTYPDGIWNYV